MAVSDPIERALPPPGGGAPGINQPVFVSGSATAPSAASLLPTFTPVFPPPLLGSGTPAFPPPNFAPLPSFNVPTVVDPDSGPTYPPLNDTGSNAIVWPDFSTTFPNPPLSTGGFMNWGPPPMITTTMNVLMGGWGQFAPGGA